jgi:hypothetical protein
MADWSFVAGALAATGLLVVGKLVETGVGEWSARQENRRRVERERVAREQALEDQRIARAHSLDDERRPRVRDALLTLVRAANLARSATKEAVNTAPNERPSRTAVGARCDAADRSLWEARTMMLDSDIALTLEAGVDRECVAYGYRLLGLYAACVDDRRAWAGLPPYPAPDEPAQKATLKHLEWTLDDAKDTYTALERMVQDILPTLANPASPAVPGPEGAAGEQGPRQLLETHTESGGARRHRRRLLAMRLRWWLLIALVVVTVVIAVAATYWRTFLSSGHL